MPTFSGETMQHRQTIDKHIKERHGSEERQAGKKVKNIQTNIELKENAKESDLDKLAQIGGENLER